MMRPSFAMTLSRFYFFGVVAKEGWTHCPFGMSMIYRNLPSKGAQRSSMVKSDGLGGKLRFSAFQQWVQIENRTIIKETMSVLAIYDSIRFLQTRGHPY